VLWKFSLSFLELPLSSWVLALVRSLRHFLAVVNPSITRLDLRAPWVLRCSGLLVALLLLQGVLFCLRPSPRALFVPVPRKEPHFTLYPGKLSSFFSPKPVYFTYMYIAIDFGSTNTRVGASRDLESFIDITKFKTDFDLLKQRHLLRDAITKVSSGEDSRFIGAGVPGVVDTKNNTFVKLANYPNLNGKKFEHLLGDDFPVVLSFFENDAALAGLAEAQRGAGMGYNVVAYITLSTGVGGVRVVNQDLENGCSLEPGHQIINPAGRYNQFSGLQGDLESYVSGRFFKENYGADPVSCEDPAVWRDYAVYLSLGIHNIINLWCPDVLIFGGGLGYNSFDKFYEPLLNNLRKLEFVRLPDIKRSHFGDDAGLYGGLALLRRSQYSGS
jgi:predicted NBD/HSP70 family sugar kinase